MALAATIYMSLLGKSGLKQVANLCFQKAHYAAEQITSLPGFRLINKSPFFNEFAIQCPLESKVINQHLLEHGILGGYELGMDYPELSDGILFAVTEMNSKEEIDYLVTLRRGESCLKQPCTSSALREGKESDFQPRMSQKPTFRETFSVLTCQCRNFLNWMSFDTSRIYQNSITRLMPVFTRLDHAQ